MARFVRWGLLSVGTVFLLLQLVRPPVDPPKGGHGQSLLNSDKLDPQVKIVLRRACADCHSYETRWPWYARIAPISLFLAKDVQLGREKLNFSEWPTDPEIELEEIYDVIERRVMPPRNYVRLHADARLTERERELILKWVTDQTGASATPWSPTSSKRSALGEHARETARALGN